MIRAAYLGLAISALCAAPRGGADGAAKAAKPDDVQRVAIVPPPPDDPSVTAGAALTDAQRAGLDPLDPAADQEQAEHRDDLVNRQTDHEAENALDPVSRGPNVGITPDTPLTARQTGSAVTDMSGRGPMPAYRDAIPQVREKLSQAMKDDADKDADQRGWRNPLEIGVPKATIEAMISDGGAPIESIQAPNGAFFPDTGTRYRLKGKSSR